MKLHTCQKEEVFDFFIRSPLAVLSTIGKDALPESALIAFAQNSDLNLYLMTFADSRKYSNLCRCSGVSLVIGFDSLTVQYQGTAQELHDSDIECALRAFADKETPCSVQYLEDPRARYFVIVPQWLRYSDYASVPPEIYESM